MKTRSVLECGSPLPLWHRQTDGVEKVALGWKSGRGLPRSKTWRLCGLLFCFLLSAFCFRALGQSYSIDWHTIDGGGGTSTGGVYSVSGTIGQPGANATAMTNGQFSVTGGFWVLPQAVQIEGAPMLTITVAARGYATVAWTPNTPGFVLQETRSLSPANWTNSVSGSTNPVTIATDAAGKFFRLRKP